MSAGPGIAALGLRGLCPRCGARSLFAGPIAFSERCRACGLDFAAFDVGDGPAAFLTLAIGAIVVAMAIALELAAAPPWWVHLVWVPVTLVAVIGSLRVAKGVLLAAEYRARGGRRNG